MKKIVAVLLILILTAGCIMPALALSEEKIYDYADLFSAREENGLQNTASALASLHNIDVSILTIADAKGKSTMKYAEDFYIEQDMGYGDEYDGLLLLIDMDNREVYIATSGKAIQYFNDDRINSILDDVSPLLSDEAYAKAAGMFLDNVEYYLKQGIKNDQYTYDTDKGVVTDRYSNTPEYKMKRTLRSLPIFILIGLGIGGATVGIMAINNKGRKTTDAGTYLDRNSFTLMDNRDIFIRTATTKRYIDTSSGSRGGGGGSRSSSHSSGGRSFGGGGRKF